MTSWAVVEVTHQIGAGVASRGGRIAEREKWIDRRFVFDLPVSRYPGVVERVRGTPARLEELVRPLTHSQLTTQVDGTWSTQENAGHLLDLEPLGAERVRQLMAGLDRFAAADMKNQRTAQAEHNSRDIADILARFRAEREGFVALLDAADAALIARAALHPRLNQPMRLIDLAFFIAEHDDHHLARISALRRLI